MKDHSNLFKRVFGFVCLSLVLGETVEQRDEVIEVVITSTGMG
jgi:hypothetical protein